MFRKVRGVLVGVVPVAGLALSRVSFAQTTWPTPTELTGAFTSAYSPYILPVLGVLFVMAALFFAAGWLMGRRRAK